MKKTTKTTTPAPHAGETEAPAIPESGQTPGMGAPPEQSTGDREPGTRPDGEAMPPAAIDPGAQGGTSQPNKDATGF